MNHMNNITPQKKHKHLTEEHLKYIEKEINYFNATKAKGAVAFKKELARKIGTSISNLYRIINECTVSILNYDLSTRKEFVANIIINSARGPSNNSKLVKAESFINDVITEFKDVDNMSSIDEIVMHKKIYESDSYNETVCTKTFYNYIHQGTIQIKPIDCPMITRRRIKRPIKVSKRHKGTSIEERPSDVETREVFGHWEGDLILGKKSESSALLTLVERKTRFQVMLKINKRTSKSVYMAINTIERKITSEEFKDIFKTITLDNGNEFARYFDIEQSPLTKDKRTTVYFAHPYSSWERGSNEHCNGLVRRKVPKGNSITEIPKDYVRKISSMINAKKRKILNYKSAKNLFDQELALLQINYNSLSSHF